MRVSAFVAAGLLSVAAVAGAQAGTISFSATLPSATLTGPTSTSLAVQQFDDSLGELTSISVALTGTVGGTLRVTRGNNGAQGSVTYSATIGTDFDLSVNAQQLFVVDVGAPVSVLVPRSTNRTGTATTTDGSGSSLLTDPGMLAFFTGLGTVSFDLGLTPENTVDSLSPANVNTSPPFGTGTQTYLFTNQSGAELRVTYNFIGVPEPVALSLFGLSLLGLGVARRMTARH